MVGFIASLEMKHRFKKSKRLKWKLFEKKSEEKPTNKSPKINLKFCKFLSSLRMVSSSIQREYHKKMLKEKREKIRGMVFY